MKVKNNKIFTRVKVNMLELKLTDVFYIYFYSY